MRFVLITVMFAVFAFGCNVTTTEETKFSPKISEPVVIEPEIKKEEPKKKEVPPVKKEKPEAANVDFDKTVEYSGGKLRLLIKEKESRFWVLKADGTPDEAFKKDDVKTIFFNAGGTMNQWPGSLTEGNATDGYIRDSGHDGEKVKYPSITIGDEEIKF